MAGGLAEALGARRLELLREMGVDVWLRRGAPGPAPLETKQAVISPAPDPGAPPRDEAAWTALRAEVAGCTRCPLHRTRTQTVFGVGTMSPRWLIIGEAPGAEEDRQGEPFVGPAGQLLNEMLRAVGVSRGDVFIANILKCRPPDNRDPRPDEAAACSGHLQRQIALLQPRLILVVGRIAAQRMLDDDAPVGRLRGRVHRWGEQGLPLVVTYHPAYLLRSPAQKARAWDDLRLACRTEPPRSP